MLVSAKHSGYLLSLLLPSVLFFAGSEGLSERQILLLLRAKMQSARAVSGRAMVSRGDRSPICAHLSVGWTGLESASDISSALCKA